MSIIATLVTNSRTLALGLSPLLLSIQPLNRVQVLPELGLLAAHLREERPTLIILDTALSGVATSETVEIIDDLAADALRVLLVNTISESSDLIKAGQWHIVIKGTAPKILAQTFESLLQNRETAENSSHSS